LDIITILLNRYNSYIYKNYNGLGVSKIMSNLQKFHRRTGGGPPPTWPASAIGGGNVTYGFWLGDNSSNKLVVAPKSTEVQRTWGSYGTVRGTTSTTNGLANTNTLYAFGSAAHPAAYYCKTLTQGGYNTWYLPAKDELNTLYINKTATPFATANSFVGSYYHSSSETSGTGHLRINMSSASQNDTNYSKNNGSYYVRAVRRSNI
jgi:hypothetical protein